MKPSVLIIDADVALCTTLCAYLETHAMTACAVHDGETGLKKALNQPFDLIMTEVLLPKMNGFELLKKLREHRNVPVFFLSARQEEIDKMLGLYLKADDYITKPCNPYELLERIQGLFRRTQNKTIQKSIIEHQHIHVDCAKRQVTISGKEIELTNTEFNILEMLIKSPGQAFSKEELTEYALGRKFTAFDRSIDVHISNLRNKMGENAVGEEVIKTIRGFGYLFNN